MKLKNIFLFILTFSIYGISLSQNGGINGTVINSDDGKPVEFANVKLKLGTEIISKQKTDFDGTFKMRGIAPGEYTLELSAPELSNKEISGITITNDILVTSFNMSKSKELVGVIFVKYVEKVIDPNGISGGQITSDELKNMPARNINSILATEAGVQTDADGDIKSIGGSRVGTTYVMVNGVRVPSTAVRIPKSAIQNITLMTGGIPAKIGDATGGVVSITTKGASPIYFGGFEYVTSGYKIGDNTFGLDHFGYNLFEGYLSGPLLKRTKEIKDENGAIKKQKNTILGFFLAGNASHIVDPRPSIIDQYILNDNKTEEFKSNPFILNDAGTSLIHNSHFIDFNKDVKKVNFNQNSARLDVSLNGTLDINLSKNTTMAIGGAYNYLIRNNYSYSNSLMNYDNNTAQQTNDWRAYVRFSQDFDLKEKNSNSKSEKSNKNQLTYFSYNILAEISRNAGKSYNDRHKEDIWSYGHVGQFDIERESTYEYNFAKFLYEKNGNFEKNVIFKPSEVNSDLSLGTKYLFDLFPEYGDLRNLNMIENFNVLTNGRRFSSADYNPYNIFTANGSQREGYAIAKNDIYRGSANSMMVIGDHNIEFGLEYEQRNNKFHSISGYRLYTLARQLQNSHIAELDKTKYFDKNIGSYIYREYEQLNSDSGEFNGEGSQSFFDYNLRKKLGLNTDGVDWLNVDNILPSDLDESFFSADELLNSGFNNSLIGYRGYTYTGAKQTGAPTIEDFFTAKDSYGNFSRPIAAFQPIYTGAYIMDKFIYKDLQINVGLRLDRYDANQYVLKDPYLFQPARTVSEVNNFSHPSNMGDDYVVYVNNIEEPTKINGYRNGTIWYDANGNEISDYKLVQSGGGIAPYLKEGVDPKQAVSYDAFQKYEPKFIVMPRINLAFPISDKAAFFAHYDILSIRPDEDFSSLSLVDYLYIKNVSKDNIINNPNLRPEKTIDYELGFQQVVTPSSSLKLSASYREMRDQIAMVIRDGAYPSTYFSYENIDFGNVKSLKVTYDQRAIGEVAKMRFVVSYTLQFAESTGSSPNSAFTMLQNNLPNLKTVYPINYDQRHQLALQFDFRFGGYATDGKTYKGPKVKGINLFSNTGLNIQSNFYSGRPYTAKSTPYTTAFISGNGNSDIKGSPQGSRYPGIFILNAQLDKTIGIKKEIKNTEISYKYKLNIYLVATNLLNLKNINFLYSATGNPNDDGYLTEARYQNEISVKYSEEAFRQMYAYKMNDPSNYNMPRQLRLGVKFEF